MSYLSQSTRNKSSGKQKDRYQLICSLPDPEHSYDDYSSLDNIKKKINSKKKKNIPTSISFGKPSKPLPVSINSNIKEDKEQKKIPQPYPKAQYMLLDEPTLANSEYTSLLNEKYPPRKYIKMYGGVVSG